jgi:hypothetical protein
LKIRGLRDPFELVQFHHTTPQQCLQVLPREA